MGIAAHRRPGLRGADVTRRHGVPVTGLVCTIVDISRQISRDELEAAVGEADLRGLIDPEQLRRALDELPPRPGLKTVRDTLDRRTFTLTRSELERRFLPILRRAGLPTPETRAYVNGFEVDFWWPELQLIVETDGLTYHRTPAQQAEDRMRDQVHTVAGLTVLRFTHAQVAYNPVHVEATLAAVAARS